MSEYRDAAAEKVINFNTKAVAEPTLLWFESYTQGAQKIGEEIGRFVSGHTRRNVDAWIALMQSPTPTKIMETQQRWLTETLRDYTDESKRLMEISNTLMQDFLSKVEHRAPAE
jgi:hypothetical protein